MTSKEELKRKLSPEQFEIYINKGTDRPFSGKYHDYKEPGIYECVCCGNDLFSSGTHSASRYKGRVGIQITKNLSSSCNHNFFISSWPTATPNR
jgi:peptide methionine sulfoxide reductase MsrB